MWMTDTLLQWLSDHEIMITRAEILGSVCSFMKELCVLLGRLSQELAFHWAGVGT